MFHIATVKAPTFVFLDKGRWDAGIFKEERQSKIQAL
jgi:hypothetical protein